MLPPETFAEIVAFLRLFDLDALAVTNASCSTLAVKASTALRWEEFPDLRFYISSQLLEITRLNLKDDDGFIQLAARDHSDLSDGENPD